MIKSGVYKLKVSLKWGQREYTEQMGKCLTFLFNRQIMSGYILGGGIFCVHTRCKTTHL
jgi:hypothetical protein